MAQQVVSWFICNGRFKVHAINAAGMRRGQIIEMEDTGTGDRIHDDPDQMLRLVDTLSAMSGLQPHRSQTFKLSDDPLFVDKVRDIVGLYLSPPNRALVLSV